jgi:hypothetical protein
MDMDADLFSPSDTAALLAIRAVMDERMLGAIELRALFDASGVIRAPGAERRAAIRTVLAMQDALGIPSSGLRSAGTSIRRR